MGLLQENKSRNKISSDPNNTKWTRDTTTFGQKILRAQGWAPGQFLGAQDAPHAALHSAASASYIRVVLKDDMKGLGFDRAKADEVTGLDVFSDVLSRLNGRSDAAVREDQDARLAVKTHRYVEMRWGPMRFVRGGLLVGNKLEADEAGAEGESSEDRGIKNAEAKREKKSKKRKADAEDDEDESDSEVTEKKDKKRRRKDGEEDAKADKKKRSKDDKKERKKSKKSLKSKDESDDSDDNESDKAARKQAKKERRALKKEKREKKEEKKRREAAKAAGSDSSSSSDSDSGSGATASATPATTSGMSTPLGNRNFSRSRIIAQKRQAVMNAKALAQIFMIKA